MQSLGGLLVIVMMAHAAWALHPDHAELLTKVKQEFERDGHASELTIDELREAVLEEPKEVDILVTLGYALLRRLHSQQMLRDDQGSEEEALTAMQKALKGMKKQGRKDESNSLHAMIVQTLYQLERFDEAAKVFQAHKLPLDVSLHQSLALRLGPAQTAKATVTEGTASAAVHSSEAIKLAPTEPTSQLAHGLAVLVDPARRDEAIKALRAAFRLRGEGASDSSFAMGWPVELEAHGRHSLARLLASFPERPEENEQLHEARDHFMEAVRIAPEHAPYQSSLKSVEWGLKVRMEAGLPVPEKNEL